MLALFHAMMQRLVTTGTVHIIYHNGQKRSYCGAPSLPEITIHFHSRQIISKMLLNPELAMGEGYMNGDVSIEGCSIYDALSLLAANAGGNDFSFGLKMHLYWSKIVSKWISKINPVKAKANVAHHYDLPPKLYDLFLDPDRQYSCAYFQDLDAPLEQAQFAKKLHLASKMRLKPGLKVLDIGCGWGGLALYLAQNFDVHVTGLTLSEEQFAYANKRAQDAGLADHVQFLMQDYREITGKFDRIVSVGMFEHVGSTHYEAFFAQVYDLLSDDGIALLHSICAEYNAGVTSDWIVKYIFPGGHIPSLSEVVPVIEKQRFHTTDIELLHHHYAATLQAWRERFMANLDQLPPHLDARFTRMWEYYLSVSQVCFEKLGLMNFQIQLMKNKNYIPLTRDYMYETEHSMAASTPVTQEASISYT